jgi:hypothetical protein
MFVKGVCEGDCPIDDLLPMAGVEIVEDPGANGAAKEPKEHCYADSEFHRHPPLERVQAISGSPVTFNFNLDITDQFIDRGSRVSLTLTWEFSMIGSATTDRVGSIVVSDRDSRRSKSRLTQKGWRSRNPSRCSAGSPQR